MLPIPLEKNQNIFLPLALIHKSISSILHLLKVLLPAKLAHLRALLLHVFSTSFLCVGVNLALNGGVEGSKNAGSQESSVDAVVDSNGCDGDS